VNERLLEELEGRINNWSPEQKIGDVFLTFVPFLKTYTIYSSNYSSGTTFTPSPLHHNTRPLLLSGRFLCRVCGWFAAFTALQTYLRCMKENKGFAQFIKDTAKYPECSFHDASDYLSAHPPPTSLLLQKQNPLTCACVCVCACVRVCVRACVRVPPHQQSCPSRECRATFFC
jgi:hypothetical protein